MDVHGGGSGSMEAGLTKIGEIRLGDASIRDKVFIVLPLDSMANTEGFTGGGMVGFETFHRFVTRIDYGANTVTLIDPKAFDPKDAGTPVPLTFNGNTPEIEGSYAGVPGKFEIDTGSRAELMLTRPFVEKNNLKSHYAKGVDAVIGWGVGGPSRGFIVRGEPLRIGDVEVKDVVTALSTDKAGSQSDESTAGNIGGGILRRFVVTLDYGHNTMYLKPASPLSPDIGAFDRAGLWMNASRDGFTVVDVTPMAPAEAAGLKAGDTIVAVDGKPSGTTPLYDLRKRLRDEPTGTVVTFTVMRGREKKDIAVTLRDLI
jgi:membrane-associated protease RseP (regulator of RpoE activity)